MNTNEENFEPEETGEGLVMPDTKGYRSDFFEFRIEQLESRNEDLNSQVEHLRHDKMTLEGIIGRQMVLIDTQLEQMKEYKEGVEELKSMLNTIKEGSEERFDKMWDVVFNHIGPGLKTMYEEVKKLRTSYGEASLNDSAAHDKTQEMIEEMLGKDQRVRFASKIEIMYKNVKYMTGEISSISKDLTNAKATAQIRAERFETFVRTGK